MKSKPKAVKPRARKPKRGKSVGGKWRMEELPAHLQVELRDRIEQSKRGDDLQDFDEAIADADRMSDEMLAVVARGPQRPAE